MIQRSSVSGCRKSIRILDSIRTVTILKAKNNVQVFGDNDLVSLQKLEQGDNAYYTAWIPNDTLVLYND